MCLARFECMSRKEDVDGITKTIAWFSHFIGQSFPLSQLAATINLGTGFVKFVVALLNTI